MQLSLWDHFSWFKVPDSKRRGCLCNFDPVRLGVTSLYVTGLYENTMPISYIHWASFNLEYAQINEIQGAEVILPKGLDCGLRFFQLCPLRFLLQHNRKEFGFPARHSCILGRSMKWRISKAPEEPIHLLFPSWPNATIAITSISYNNANFSTEIKVIRGSCPSMNFAYSSLGFRFAKSKSTI